MEFIDKFEAELDRMIEHQRGKVQKDANIINPNVTREDILNPQDFPELKFDFQFNYEDGILSGMLATKMMFSREKNIMINPPVE